MLTNAQILDTLKQAFDYLSSEYGVKRIGIFGSCAKGQLTDKSDVDIIVEFERPLGLRFVEFAEYLENLLGRDVDILTSVRIYTRSRGALTCATDKQASNRAPMDSLLELFCHVDDFCTASLE
jgi:predicted nucleotidyltransferase